MENMEHFCELSRRALYTLHSPDLGQLAPKSLLTEADLNVSETYSPSPKSYTKSFDSRHELNRFAHTFVVACANRFGTNQAAFQRWRSFISNTCLDYFSMQNPDIAEIGRVKERNITVHFLIETRMLTSKPNMSMDNLDQTASLNALRAKLENLKSVDDAMQFIDSYGLWYASPSKYVHRIVTINGSEAFSDYLSLPKVKERNEMLVRSKGLLLDRFFEDRESIKPYIEICGRAFSITLDLYEFDSEVSSQSCIKVHELLHVYLKTGIFFINSINESSQTMLTENLTNCYKILIFF
jgi:hypothetical protein